MSAHAELAKTQPTLTCSLVVPTVPNRIGLASLINVDRYSSFDTLLCVSAYMLRFVDSAKNSRRCRVSLSVTADEMKRAERTWI